MVRVYNRKSDRGEYGEERLATALEAINQGMPLIQASREMGIPARTLRRHRDRCTSLPGVLKLGRHTTTLSVALERELHDHIQYMEKALYGLTPGDVRRLAFDVAEAASINHRFCKKREMVGKDWLSGFLEKKLEVASTKAAKAAAKRSAPIKSSDAQPSTSTTSHKKQQAKRPKTASTAAARSKARKRKAAHGADDSSSEDEEWPRIICGEPFASIRSREKWIQCQQCQKWAHKACSGGSHYFIRPNCESD